MASTLPTYNITVIEGADYAVSLTLTEDNLPVDLTGYTFQAQLRENFAEYAPVLGEFTCTLPNPATGEVVLSLSAATTQNMFATTDANRARGQVGYWDVFYTSPTGVREYLLGGRVFFIQTITARVAV